MNNQQKKKCSKAIMTVKDAKEFNFLDDIKFKFIKNLTDEDMLYWDVYFNECNNPCFVDSNWFLENELEAKNNLGIDIYSIKIKRHHYYNTSSIFAMKCCEWFDNHYNEESDNSDQENDEDK